MRYFIERRLRDSGKLQASERVPQVARTPCVLVVESEPAAAPALEAALHDEVYVERCGRSAAELQRALERSWSLVVIDWSHPPLEAAEIARQLEQLDGSVPILVLTAPADERSWPAGLEVNEDNRLIQPFGVAELLARARGLLQQHGVLPDREAHLLRAQDLVLDLARREVRRDERRLRLTTREFDLLAYLMRNRGRVYSRAQLLHDVWGATGHADEHTVSSHVNRLRAKLEPEPGAPRYVLTVWGVGYRFAND